MFTGIVEHMGRIAAVKDEPPGKRFEVQWGDEPPSTEIGDSIAINGCCLTVVSVAGDTWAFDAGEETLRRTNLGALHVGSPVNLERSLRFDARLGGHFVTGHVDALGHLDERRDSGDWSFMWFRCPGPLTRQMASKGSITVDGVSLTLVDVESERFSVALIPHTLLVTTLGRLRPGDAVNLETDVLAKYVERQLLWLQPSN